MSEATCGNGPFRTSLTLIRVTICFAAFLISSDFAHAAGLDGAAMGWPWALPFIGMLLSIAAGPLLFRRLWHQHYGKIAAGWAAIVLLALAARFGAMAAVDALVRALLAEYLSFIVV